MRRAILLSLSVALGLPAQQYTRGVGVYPGAPEEDFGPVMVVDAASYRNLALHRPAYQSSSYDYNLTAQLVTDGIKETALPGWVSVSASEIGTLRKADRESVLDHNLTSGVDLHGAKPWVELGVGGGGVPPEVDRVELFARVESFGPLAGPARSPLRRRADVERTGANGGHGSSRPAVPDVHGLHGASRNRFYRVAFEAASARRAASRGGAVRWEPARGDRRAVPLQQRLDERGLRKEWVYVDLGAHCTFDRVALTGYGAPRKARSRFPTTPPPGPPFGSCRQPARLPTISSLPSPPKRDTCAC